jgi:hypothetical protein
MRIDIRTQMIIHQIDLWKCKVKFIIEHRYVTSFNKKRLKRFNSWHLWDPLCVWAILLREYDRPSRPLIGEQFEIPAWDGSEYYTVEKVIHLHQFENDDEETFHNPELEGRRREGPLTILKPDRFHIPLEGTHKLKWRSDRREELINASGLIERGFWIHDASWNYDPLLKHLRSPSERSPLCPRCLRLSPDPEGRNCLNCGMTDPYKIEA